MLSLFFISHYVSNSPRGQDSMLLTNPFGFSTFKSFENPMQSLWRGLGFLINELHVYGYVSLSVFQSVLSGEGYKNQRALF